MSAEPRTEKPVAEADEEVKAPSPAYDLTGQIVFLRANEAHDAEVFVMLANEEEATRVFTHAHVTNSNALFPRWSEDRDELLVHIYEGEGWAVASLKPDGTGKRMRPEIAVETLSRPSREPDITVSEGSVSITGASGDKVVLYTHKSFDPDDRPGAMEASWGPEKNHVIFEVCDPSCVVHVMDTQGKQVRMIKGAFSPDWK